MRIVFNNLDSISTSSVYDTGLAKNLESRILGTPDVVVVNSRNKVILSNPVKEKIECWLPDQALLNSNCKVKHTEISNAIDLVSSDLKYNEVVNMRDVTGLDQVNFSDMVDLGQLELCIPKFHKAKMINFLDKYSDSGTIDEKDTWDISESRVPENPSLRIGN